MGWFKKKPDPVSDRERMLDQQIAALETQIKQLSTRLAQPEAPPSAPAQPRLRSTALPHGPTVHASPPSPAPSEPAFEEIGPSPLESSEEAREPEPPADLGVKKEGWSAWWARLKRHFEAPTTSNPRLVNYLAAGSIQGLRPLRYEKRVARNRFVALVALLILLLLGSFFYFFRR